MRLAWHIVTKDARRLWLPLALWGVLLTLQNATEWRLSHWPAAEADGVERLKGLALMLKFLGYFVGYILAAAVIREDPPHGSTAFWMTRPLSGARLLGAKLLGCAVLLGALPYAFMLPWWLAATDLDQVLPAARELLGWRAVTVAPAIVVAALTESAGSFLAWTVAVQMSGVWSLVYWQSLGPIAQGEILEKRAGGLALALGITLAGTGTAVVLQYGAKRKGLACAILAGSVVGAASIAVLVSG